MKKILAYTLALAILMACGLALAETVTNGGKIESNSEATAAVSVPYTASTITSVTISWEAPSFTFTWNGTTWTPDANTKDLTFKVINNSTANKTVKIESTEVGKSSWLEAQVKNNKDSVTLYPVAGVEQLKQDTIVYELTASDVSTLGGLTTGENQSGTMNFTVTVGDPTL